MIRCERYEDTTGSVESISFADVSPLLSQPNVLLWVDVANPDPQELEALTDVFGFHPLAMEDVRNRRQRAKVDRYEAFFFIVLPIIHYHAEQYAADSDELDLFLGANYLVTIHRDAIPMLSGLRRRWEAGRLLHAAPAFLFYLLADAVVDSYFPIVDEIGDQIDQIDESIFTQPVQEVLQAIFSLRRALLVTRKILGPMRDAFNELIRQEEDRRVFPNPEQTRAYFMDVFDHILRITDFVDNYRDMLSGSLDAFQSSLANRLNENMQRLTVAATVLATATLITGFYGMNVRGLGINNLAYPYGGPLLLLALVVITLVEIWLFRRKGWL